MEEYRVTVVVYVEADGREAAKNLVLEQLELGDDTEVTVELS